MNAFESTKKMAQTLIEAGFEVKVEDTDNHYSFSAISKSALFDTTYIFNGFASTTYSGRARKWFSATRSMAFAKSQSKRNISYAQMWNEIDWAIKMTNRDSAKVGA